MESGLEGFVDWRFGNLEGGAENMALHGVTGRFIGVHWTANVDFHLQKQGVYLNRMIFY